MYLHTISTSSPEPLNGFWWNLVGMKYSWSPASVVVFRPEPPIGGSRAGHNRLRRGPSYEKLLLQTGCIEQQTKCIRVIYKDVGWSVVVFGSIPKSNFWHIFDIFSDFVNLADFHAISMGIPVVSWLRCITFEYCSYINVNKCVCASFTFIMMFNFFILQFYSEKGEGGGSLMHILCI